MKHKPEMARPEDNRKKMVKQLFQFLWHHTLET
jgi:hypothetical protein